MNEQKPLNEQTTEERALRKIKEYQEKYVLLRDEYIAHLFLDGTLVASSENIFKEYADREKHESIGAVARVNNLGYFSRCYNAFWYALAVVPNVFKANDIIEINRIAMGAASHLLRPSILSNEGTDPKYFTVSYPLNYANATVRGINELLERWGTSVKKHQSEFLQLPNESDTRFFKPYIEQLKYEDNEIDKELIGAEAFEEKIKDMLVDRSAQLKWYAPHVSVEKDKNDGRKELYSKINELLNSYFEEKNKIDNELKDGKVREDDVTDHQITMICNLITSLEQLHPFRNGNCRTICMILLNKLLIESNLLPVLQHNPNKFDGHSVTEMSFELHNSLLKSLHFGIRYAQPSLKTDKEKQDCAADVLKRIYSLDKEYRSTTFDSLEPYQLEPGCLSEISIDKNLENACIVLPIKEIYRLYEAPQNITEPDATRQSGTASDMAEHSTTNTNHVSASQSGQSEKPN